MDNDNLSNISSFLYLIGKHRLSIRIMKKRLSNIELLQKKNIKLLDKIRFFTANEFGAIGHIAYIDFYIKSDRLNYTKLKKNILLDEVNKFSNTTLIQIYENEISKLPSNLNNINVSEKKLLTEELGLIKIKKNHYVWHDKWVWSIQKKWIEKFGKKPIYNLKYKTIVNSERFLKQFGFEPNKWFVTVHIREEGGGQMMGLRNAYPNSYEKAIKSVIDNGGWVFRIGDSSMKNPLRLNTNQYVDLTNFNQLNPDVDAYLLSKCRFFIGTGSGPMSIAAHIFCRPVLLTNASPMSSRIPWPDQLILPKMYYNISSKLIIPLSLRLKEPLGRLESSYALKDIGYKAVNNSSDEIKSATDQMINLTRLKNFNVEILDIDIRQKKFKKISSDNNNLCKVYCADIILDKYPDFLN